MMMKLILAASKGCYLKGNLQHHAIGNSHLTLDEVTHCQQILPALHKYTHKTTHIGKLIHKLAPHNETAKVTQNTRKSKGSTH